MLLGRVVSKVFVSRAIATVLEFAAIAYFAKVLSTSTLGVYFLFLAVVGMASILGDAGFTGATLKRISEQEDTSEFFASGLFVVLVLSGLVAAGVLILNTAIQEYFNADMAFLIAIAVPARVLSGFLLAVIRAEHRIAQTAKYNVLRKFFWIIGSIAFVSLGIHSYGLIYSQIAAFLLVLCLAAIEINTPIRTPSVEKIKSLYNYAKFGISAYLDSFLYKWLDVLLIGLFVTQAAVGVYEIAWRVSAAVMLFSSAIETTITPHVSTWDATGDHESIEQLVPDAIFWSMFLVVPSVVGVALLGEEILKYVFTADYSSGALPLLILMVGKLVESIDRPIKQIISGMDRPNLRMRGALASIIANLVLNTLLIPYLGLLGAAIGTTVSFAFSTVLMYYWVSRHIQVQPPDNTGWITFSALFMGGVIYGISQVVPVTSIVELSITVLIAVIIYLGAALSRQNIRANAIGYLADNDAR